MDSGYVPDVGETGPHVYCCLSKPVRHQLEILAPPYIFAAPFNMDSCNRTRRYRFALKTAKRMVSEQETCLKPNRVIVVQWNIVRQ